MKRRNWALVTGAIRSDLYLRIIMIKLCNMRTTGKLEGIVLSTWKQELDSRTKLREQLLTLGIKILETPLIDETTATDNVLGLERQRVLIDNGLKAIPFGCFVLKLRTDFDIDIKELFDILEEENYADLPIEYGKFPINFQHKIYVRNYLAKHMFYPNDRYFYGQREDLEKLMIPVSYTKLVKFHYDVEVELIAGYAFYTYPILRRMADLLKAEFYEQYLFAYCRKKDNKELNIPHILLRSYATILVFVYTHFKFWIDRTVSLEQCPLPSMKDLFSGRISNGYQIEMILSGKVVDSPLVKEFKDELLKVILNMPECNIYTRGEYMELKDFVSNEIGHPELIADYPVFDDRKDEAFRNADTNILLSEYKDSRTHTIADMALNFNSVSEIYNTVKNPESLNQLEMDLIEASIFDKGDNNATYAYYVALLDNKIKEKEGMLDQCIRYQILFAFRINTSQIDLVYVNFFLALLYCKRNNNKSYYKLADRFARRQYGGRIQYKNSDKDHAEIDLIKSLIDYIKNHEQDFFTDSVKKAFYKILCLSKKYGVSFDLNDEDMCIAISCLYNYQRFEGMHTEAEELLEGFVSDFNIDTFLSEKKNSMGIKEFFNLMTILLMKNCLLSYVKPLIHAYGNDFTNRALIESFLYCTKNPVRLFSLKSDNEMWFHYIPFCERKWNEALVVARNSEGLPWPWCDFPNDSVYAAYLKIVDKDLCVSIEFCSEPGEAKVNCLNMAKLYDVDAFDINAQIIRLKIARFSFHTPDDIKKAVHQALDEFCRIGDALTKAAMQMESSQPEK